MPSDEEKTKRYKVQNAKKRKKNIPSKKNRKTPQATKRVETKGTKTSQAKKVSSGKNRKNKKERKKHPKLAMAFKILIVLFLLLCVVGAGIIAGMFFGLFGDEFEITKEELKIGASNSVIVDANGGVIANLSGDEKRKIITLDEMADYLPKAYVAIEDERFYKHSGVDFKRTAGAILHTVTGNSSYGGSTITQQLVKNITKDDEASGIAGIMRKVKEWAKAYQVERMISKNQILELYLNILYVGGEGNLHGVELGAQYYFNKSAKDLSLAECAFLAGINSSPNYYNPYKLYSDTDTEEKRDERIKSKTLTVLAKMKELGYIENEQEYNEAVAQVEAGLTFSNGTETLSTNYSYHTDAVIDQVITQVMEEKGISRQLAENYVYSSGLTIYSTVDNAIQARVEEEYKKEKYIKSGKDKNKDGTLLNDHTQSGMAIIDYKTGYVVGVAGGLGEKTGANLNRATQITRQTGSSIKPIADISPALEEKIITAATLYDDVKTDFNGYQPKNDGNKYRGIINIRDIIAYSQNVPEVKIMKELTPSKSIDYLRNYGISTLTKAEDDPVHNDEGLPLAIGGLKEGISPLEMAAAYSAIANGGEYITPTFYTKVVDSSGNTVLTPKQEKRRVISEQNAYLTTSIIQEPVKKGTATYCAISGIDVAAKTGTTDDSYDRWLCGFTPYYAAATWFGYDKNEEITGFTTNPAGQIWDAVMTDIHKNLPKASFTRPSGIVEKTVCKTTGCLAVAGCTETYTEIFSSNNIPENCPGHGSQRLCTESNLIATEYCPNTKINNYGATIPKEQLKLWKTIGTSNTGTSGKQVTEVCTIHTAPVEQPNLPQTNTNTGNTTSGNNTSSSKPNEENTGTSGNETSGGTTGGNAGGNTGASGNEGNSGETSGGGDGSTGGASGGETTGT